MGIVYETMFQKMWNGVVSENRWRRELGKGTGTRLPLREGRKKNN